MDLKSIIRTVPHWPVKGVMFRDITTLLQDGPAFRAANDIFFNRYKDMTIDKIVGIDARGFIFGAVLADRMGIGFVPVRKKGKLPHDTIHCEYTLEYGSNTVEMHKDAIQSGEKVVIIDDLIATGGTIKAAINLVEQVGGIVLECGFIIDLPDLKGREKISRYKVFTMMEFEGE